MIVNDEGRKKSVRTAEESLGILEGDLKDLSPDEIAVLRTIFEEIKHSGRSAILEVANEIEYDKPIVPMAEWLADPYFFGEIGIWPVLKHDLVDLFTNDYYEAILSGGIGWGKTTLAAAGLGRILYEVSCLKDPQKSYGMAAGSIISMATISLTEDLARKVVFEKLSGFLRSSPYFKEHFPFKETQDELRFPKNVCVTIGSSTNNAILGMDLMSAIMDEGNFYGEVPMRRKSIYTSRTAVVDNAQILYSQVNRRIKSRYQKKGRLPGMLFLVSSKRGINDFIERRIKESLTDPHVFIREYAIWSVKPEKYDMTQTFRVLVGDEHISSRILRDDEEDPKELSVDSGVKVVEIPLELKSEFEKDLEGALRDTAGIATISVYPFIRKRRKIDDAISTSLFHPHVEESWDTSLPSSFMWDKIVQKDPRTGLNKPLLHPNAMRHAHIDTSLTGDCSGIAIGHIAGERNVTRKDEDGNEYTEPMPIIFMDLMLRCVPPPGGEITLGDMRKVIYSFVEHGYNIGMVTVDSYQSADTVQQLKQKGIESQVLSVDKNINVYVSLRDALYDDRFFMYDYKPTRKELRELEFKLDKKKVDHPTGGSKDVSDAIAGVVYTLSTMPTDPLPMTMGGSSDVTAMSIRSEQYEERMKAKKEMETNIKKAGGDIIDKFFKDMGDEDEGDGVVPPIL